MNEWVEGGLLYRARGNFPLIYDGETTAPLPPQQSRGLRLFGVVLGRRVPTCAIDVTLPLIDEANASASPVNRGQQSRFALIFLFCGACILFGHGNVFLNATKLQHYLLFGCLIFE